jgi:thymidine phosphorylase
VMQVLQNSPDAPDDLRQKSLRLAGRVLEFDPDVRGGRGYAIARDIIDSGRALEMMNTIIKAQGVQSDKFELGKLTHEVLSPQAGVVVNIDNLQMAHIARFAGAPIDKGAGVDLFKKLGDKVKKGEALYRIHAEFPSDFNFATALCERDSGYLIGKEDQIPKAFVEF